jgi:hypothetical protein
MWVITPLGFYSVVSKPKDMESGTITIRARVKSDLEALRQECLPSLGAISEDKAPIIASVRLQGVVRLARRSQLWFRESIMKTSRTRRPTSWDNLERKCITRFGTFFSASNAVRGKP